ncbi:MAG: CinA family nicotinamide mononucleotide deamidase-related protein [Bacteroidales bacterium]|nr:CinA family nicotinamide mononucleotide deamidase-related protein [Bacteroidales bacterium]
MNVTILNIGDELLIGQVVNTNAAKMSQMLTQAGMAVKGVYTIGDLSEDIGNYLRHCLSVSDVVLMTGGLGPTKDDITKKTLCEFFGSELYENEEALENVRRIVASHGRELTEINRLQAWVPRCCTMINNVLGTAPCMWFETDDCPSKVVVSLPGVPFEMENLMQTEVVPRLREHFAVGAIVNKNLLLHGIGESFLSDLIEPWELALPENIRLAYLPQPGLMKLRLTARGDDSARLQHQIDEAVAGLYPIAGQYIMGEDAESLPELVARTMVASGRTLATAESCTGGNIAAKLTALPGASAYFRGGVVAYSNEVKESELGVRHETLVRHGAVSEETVREMVTGARERLGADYAVATTGVAGPSGGTPEKPVGTVWIAVASADGVSTELLHLTGRRAQIVERTCNAVFAALLRVVRPQ